MKKFSSTFLVLAFMALAILSGGCSGKSDRFAEDVKSLRISAANGNSQAQARLAQVYELALYGIDGNMAASLHWLRKVAEKGDPKPQYLTGMIYYRGEGVNKDESEGLYWINQAAQQGYEDAINFLNKTPHGLIKTSSSNPFNWGYYLSSAVLGDLWDSSKWIFILGILLTLGPWFPVGLGIFVYLLYQI